VTVTIRRVLVGAFVALQLAVFGILLALFHHHASRAVENEARSAIDVAVAEARRRTEGFLAPAPAAITMTRALVLQGVIDPADSRSLLHLFHEFLVRDSSLAAVYLGSNAGDFVFLARNPADNGFISKVIRHEGGRRSVGVGRYDSAFGLVTEAPDTADEFDPRTRPWFAPAIESGSIVWSSPYEFYTTKLEGVTASHSVARAGAFPGGAIGVDVSLAALSQFLADLKLGAGNRAVLLARDGGMIAAPGVERLRGPEAAPGPMVDALLQVAHRSIATLAEGETAFARFDHAGEPHLGAVALLPGTRTSWVLALAVPRASYFRWFDTLRNQVVIFALGAIGVGLLGAVYFAARLAGPFERLAANAAALRDGSYGRLAAPASRIAEARATEEAFDATARGLRERDEDNTDLLFALRRFGEAVGQSPLAIFFTEPDGTLSYANQAFSTLTGFELIDVINEPPVAFWRAGDAGPGYVSIFNVVSRGQVWRGEIESRTKAGKNFDALMTVAPIRTASGRTAGCAGILEDITERKQTQAALERAVEEATRLARARSTFLANMSHEIRTPLNAIIGFAETMEARLFGPLGDPHYEEYVRDIRQSGEHLLSVLVDVLDASTLEAGKIELREEPVIIADLVQTTIRMVENAAAARQVAVTAALDPTIRVRADPVRLRQVALNILSNAVKYTPSGGRIEVQVLRRDGGVEVHVRDTGVGISSQNLDWVMKPFARETSDAFVASTPGVGLGLPIARSLMELHRGTLVLTSTPGQGTLVVLRLPPERMIDE